MIKMYLQDSERDLHYKQREKCNRTLDVAKKRALLTEFPCVGQGELHMRIKWYRQAKLNYSFTQELMSFTYKEPFHCQLHDVSL